MFIFILKGKITTKSPNDKKQNHHFEEIFQKFDLNHLTTL